MSQQIQEVPLDKIETNPVNPSTRTPDKELVASIKHHGILTPLLVRKNEAGKYVIIAGERRYKAAGQLNMKDVPILVQDVNADEGTTLLLVDNIHRKNMTLWEEYQVISELQKAHNLTQIGKAMHKPYTYVARRAQLGNLIPALQKAVQENAIGFTDRIAFILAQTPHAVQKTISKVIFSEAVLDGKNRLVVTRDERDILSLAKEQITETLFRKPDAFTPDEVINIFGTDITEGGAVSSDATTTLFEEGNVNGVAKPEPEVLKKAKEFLRTVKGAWLLFNSSYVPYGYGQKALTREYWRVATDEDDQRTVKEGVIAEGKKMGLLVSFVTVDPKEEAKKQRAAERAKRLEKAKSDPKVAEQLEKDRAERRDKILTNKAHTRALAKLWEAVLAKTPKLTPDFVNFLTDHQSSDTSRILKWFCTPEEFEKIGWADLHKKLWQKYLCHYEPVDAMILCTIGSILTSYEPEIAKFWGLNWTTMVNEQKKLITAEREAAKKKKK